MDFPAGDYLSEAPSLPRFPPHSLTATHCLYIMYFDTRKWGGGESWTREKVRGAKVQKAGWKIPT